MSDDPLDDDWSEDIEKALHAHRLRDKAPYDGIMGELPKGFFGNFQLKFHTIRNRLLETYTHEELLDYISDAQRMFDPDEDYVRPCIPLKIIRDITTLMRFQEAVRLDKEVSQEAGLAFLTDSDLAKQVTIGVKQYKNLAKGNPAAAKKKTEKAADHHKQWQQWALDFFKNGPSWWGTEEVLDKVCSLVEKNNHTMANGKPYARRTIADVITGIKKTLKIKN